MELKLKKGFSYVVILQNKNDMVKRGYIIQQTAQRTWIATLFTNVDNGSPFYSSNAVELPVILSHENLIVEVQQVGSHGQLRKLVYNVCKYGKMDGGE